MNPPAVETTSSPRLPTAGPVALSQYLAGKVLHLILMPTEKCNFRCVYCYEDFEHGRMSRPVVQGLCRLLAGRVPTLDSLTIQWFGGEPLLELPIIEEVQGHVRQLGQLYPSLRARAGMTTNGYRLSREVLTRLVDLGVRSYQISIDGPQAAHDARRMRGCGAGTFDRVWTNLLAAHASDLDFKIRLRIHVDRENRDEIPTLLDSLAMAIGGDERFEVFLRPVSRLGGPNDDTLPVLVGEETAVVEELRRLAADLGLTIHVPGGAKPCYAAAANSFVIRSTGEIAKCTVAFQHPNNRVGRLHPDGTATLDNAKINGWVRGLFSGEAAELRCPMHGFADRTPTSGALRIVSA